MQGVEKTLEEDGAVRETQMEMVFTIIVERGEEVQCSAVLCCVMPFCEETSPHNTATSTHKSIQWKQLTVAGIGSWRLLSFDLLYQKGKS